MLNVSKRSGFVRDALQPSGNASSNWHFKDAPDLAVQCNLTSDATQTAASTITLNLSNDGVNVAASVTVTCTTTVGTNGVATGTVLTGPWKYFQAVVSGSSGTNTKTAVIVSV